MAKAIKYIKFSAIVLLFVGLIGYIVFAMMQMSDPDPTEVCCDVELLVNKNAVVDFVDETTLEALLKSQKLYPKGKLMKEVDIRAIEDLLRNSDCVESVECYKTAGGVLHIDVVQRNPVIYVIPENADGYYVDRAGRLIKSNVFTSNIVVATGHITPAYAAENLAGIGYYLQHDKFWNGQIEQIYVKLGPKNQPVIEIVPRVGDHLVYLGPIDDFDKKLRRLRVFYEKAMGTVGWNKYDRINLEYKNQIICTKRKFKK